MHLYLFIRTDLSPVVQTIQCAHVTFELGLDLQRSSYPDPVNFVLFGVNSERDLIKLKRELEQDGIRCHTFFESDYNIGYTALATEPLLGEARQRFAHLAPYGWIDDPQISA